MTGGLDRAGRIAAWVLSGVATVALVGSIATVSDTVPREEADRQATIVDPADPNAPRPRPLPPALDPERAGANLPPPTVTPATASAQAARVQAGWLEALTYAVLALVAVMAAGVVVLARISAQLSRMTPDRN